MRRLVYLALLLPLGCGGSSGTQDGPDGGAAATDGMPSAGNVDSAVEPVSGLGTIYVWDQGQGDGTLGLYRLVDVDADYDFDGADEVSLFFDDTPPGTGVMNAQGILVRPDGSILITDNWRFDEPDRGKVVRLEDLNGDGDALDDGESSVWYSGELPAGQHVSVPTTLVEGPDGFVYMVDNNLNTYGDDYPIPYAIYGLYDEDGNGEINIDSEMLMHYALAPAGGPPTGVFVMDVAIIEEVGTFWINVPGNHERGLWRWGTSPDPQLLFNDVELFTERGMAFGSTFQNKIGADAEGRIYFFGYVMPDGRPGLISCLDADQDGEIDLDTEVSLHWAEDQDSADYDIDAMRDLQVIDPHNILAVTADTGSTGRIYHFRDDNQDGDFNDEGEVRPVFDNATSESDVVFSETVLTIALGSP